MKYVGLLLLLKCVLYNLVYAKTQACYLSTLKMPDGALVLPVVKVYLGTVKGSSDSKRISDCNDKAHIFLRNKILTKSEDLSPHQKVFLDNYIQFMKAESQRAIRLENHTETVWIQNQERYCVEGKDTAYSLKLNYTISLDQTHYISSRVNYYGEINTNALCLRVPR